MTGYDSYTFILCLIVFILLTTFSGIVIGLITKQSLRLIRCGADDDKITKEYYKSLKKKKSCTFDCLFSLTMCIILVIIFAFSLFVGLKKDAYSDTMPLFKVVKTGSMEEKNSKNEYLFKNDLDNQIGTFDLVLVYKKPSMNDLKLYDIVVYEVDGIELIHRIVGIEEPNERHPDERWFTLQGDAVESPDRFPVKYEQIKGIYKDQHVPFVGSFILFMQSPAGWLCIMLVVGAIIITPILEKKLKKVKYIRLVELGVIDPDDQPKKEPDEDDEDYVRPDFLNDNELLGALLSIESAVSEDVFDDMDSENVQSEEIASVEEEKITEKEIAQKTFTDKLEESTNFVKQIQGEVEELLLCFENAVLSNTNTSRTIKSKNIPLARFEFIGKTLYVYLSLDPKAYVNSKYIFTDVSTNKQFKNYPMRVILSSERQRDHVKELVLDIAKNNNINVVKPSVPVIQDDRPLFMERLSELPGNLIRYYSIIRNEIDHIDGVYMVDGYDREFRTDDQPIACMDVIGKSLYVYLSRLEGDIKDIYCDLIPPKNRIEDYPCALKLSSMDDVDIVKELLRSIVKDIWVSKNETYL